MAASNGHDPDGLTVKQAQFAQLISKGWTGADAYRQAYDASGMKPESIWQEAARTRAIPHVAARIKDLLSQARLQDLDSIGQAIQRSLELCQEAREHRNYSAAAKVNADLLKMHGLLRDTLVVQWEQGLSDDQLLARLAGNDPVRLEAARALLRAPDSFDDPTIIEVIPKETQEDQ